ncbi:MAG: FAD:protein FMN transferase [Gammaproteobacteria bacterium]|nr:FAD:protein FMN transferase [Gammaproteobacteria bacterium]
MTQASGYWVGRFAAMASPCEVLCEAPNRAQALALTKIAAAEAWRIEDRFSRYRAGNVIDRINTAAGAAVSVDAETAQLIDFSRTLYELSHGKFDVTSGVLRRVWVFDGSDNIPDAAAVQSVMPYVGWQRVSWQSPTLQMPAGMQIDLGGIGKEYAVDRAAELLRQASDLSCLVNLGGDLVVTRQPRFRDCWSVGIESTAAQVSLPASLLKLKVGALATSGDARRYLLKGKRRYSHILDPKTGWPVPNAPRSVTVAADTCTQAGMLSTLAMLEGDAAEAFLAAQGVQYWCDRGSEFVLDV